MDAIKTIKEIAQEVGVSKQAVFKRMSKEPLKSALASLDNGIITSESNKIYLSDSAVDLLKSAFWEKYAIKDVKKKPAGTYSGPSTFFMSENTLSTPEEAHVKAPVVLQQEPPRRLAEEQDLINLLTNQLQVKDQQLKEKDEQIQAKDKQIGEILKTVNELADVLKRIHAFMAKMSDETLRQPPQTTIVNEPVIEPAAEHFLVSPPTPADNTIRVSDISNKELSIPIQVHKAVRVPEASTPHKEEALNKEADIPVDNTEEVLEADPSADLADLNANEEFLDTLDTLDTDEEFMDDPVDDAPMVSDGVSKDSENPLSNTARILDMVNKRSNPTAKPIDFKNIVSKTSSNKAKAAPARSIEDDFDFLLKRRLSNRRDG